MQPRTTPPLVTFAAGGEGAWRIDAVATLVGLPLPSAQRLAVGEPGSHDPTAPAA